MYKIYFILQLFLSGILRAIGVRVIMGIMGDGATFSSNVFWCREDSGRNTEIRQKGLQTYRTEIYERHPKTFSEIRWLLENIPEKSYQYLCCRFSGYIQYR